LNRVPVEARIIVVTTMSDPSSSGRESALTSLGESEKSQSRLTSAATVISTSEEVREQFKRVKPLKGFSVTQHGWTVAVFGRKPPS
jgi:hypothetical protein